MLYTVSAIDLASRQSFQTTAPIRSHPTAKMLSNNPTTNLRQQRLHRRTQSTMDPYPTTEPPSIPNTNTQRLSMHRRGISLDNRRPTSAEEQYSNSEFNPQQAMRGLQQQRLQQNQSPFFYNPTNEENYLISPGMTPQRQSLDGMQRQSFDGGNLMDMFGAPMQPQPYTQFPTTLSLDARPVTADGNMHANQFASQDSSFYQQESGAITPSAYIDFTQALETLNDDWGATVKPASRPSSRPLSRNFARQFDVPGTGTSSTRHLTPPSADSSSKYFDLISLTPAYSKQVISHLPPPHHLTAQSNWNPPARYLADFETITTCP